MSEFLLECYSEEIPASYQQPAAEQLRALMLESCAEYFGDAVKNIVADAYVTPKRLVLHMTGVPTSTEPAVIEERGPREGAPEKALAGFARGKGVDVDALTLKDTPKGTFYFYQATSESKPSAELLADATTLALASLHWPKSMQWNTHTLKWPRPLQNILCIFDGNILPLTLAHLSSNQKTFLGMPHRQETLEVTSFRAYKEALLSKNIILCRDERMAFIRHEAEKAADILGFKALYTSALIEEIAGLVECPVPLTGSIDQEFLSLPKQALFSVMKSHQKYIPLVTSKDDAAPAFFFVGENVLPDYSDQVIKGNERVLRARLQDALFFETQDHSKPLADLRGKLQDMTFHAELGTVYERSERLMSLSKLIAIWVPGANLVDVERAALLCKCDLATLMVGEFPELQGFIGGQYALRDGETDAVSRAIEEHYLPSGPYTRCPDSPVSIVLALSDKIDALVGLFVAGERATGSRDPYGLRRNALAVIRLITENNIRISLRLLLEKSMARYPAALFKEDRKGLKRVIPMNGGAREKKSDTMEEMLLFFQDRLRALLKEQGVAPDIIAAAMSDKQEYDIVRTLLKLKALKKFTEDDALIGAMSTVYRRVSGIVEKQEKDDDAIYGGSAVAQGLLVIDEEKALYDAVEQIKEQVKEYNENEDFFAIFNLYARILPVIKAFFDHVIVNDEHADIRENRLHLLGSVRDLMMSVIDFSRLQISEDTGISASATTTDVHKAS